MNSHVLLLFIDGIGLGKNDPAQNPFAARNITFGTGAPLVLPAPKKKRRYPVIPTDACLDIAGLPQSATGQCTILTGINAAAHLGHHLQAYPNRKLADLLAANGIFSWCRDHGFKATFANGFRREYWDLVAQKKLRHSATTLSVLGAGGKFRDENDYRAGEAVYHDLTGATLQHLGKDIPVISLTEAAKRILHITHKHHFTLFEYFITDVAGHRRHHEKAAKILDELDRFIHILLEGFDPSTTDIILTSDHGNLEDFTIKSHTLNPVPTILYGHRSQKLSGGIRSLTDIVPTICSLLSS